MAKRQSSVSVSVSSLVNFLAKEQEVKVSVVMFLIQKFSEVN